MISQPSTYNKSWMTAVLTALLLWGFTFVEKWAAGAGNPIDHNLIVVPLISGLVGLVIFWIPNGEPKPTTAELLKRIAELEAERKPPVATGLVPPAAAVVLLILLLPLLSGCGGSVGALGLSTAGNVTGQIVHRGAGCPDVAFQGSVPLAGLKAGCIYDPGTRRTSETLSLDSSDPTSMVIQSNAQLTGILAKTLGAAVSAGGAAFGVPIPNMANGAATAMPWPGVSPGPPPLVPPTP